MNTTCRCFTLLASSVLAAACSSETSPGPVGSQSGGAGADAGAAGVSSAGSGAAGGGSIGAPGSSGGSLAGVAGTAAASGGGAGMSGSPASGGASVAGSSGTAGGGQASTGGAGGGDATRSAGCGKPAPAATTARQTLDVDGTAREYILVYPSSYDSNKPYRVMFEFHGSTGTAEENIRFKWYGVEPLAQGSVIFVAPQGLGNPTGWPNSGGQDVAFTRKLATLVNDTFCVDTSRIFATGFSYGAMFSNTLGCQMGDVFRAIGPASGGGPNGKCVGKPAAIVIHGSADSTVNITSGEGSRDHWLEANHCGTTTTPFAPSPCVSYEGCDAGYPVVWCQHTGGHQINTTLFGPALWNFFSQF